jgi:hypothetical protein
MLEHHPAHLHATNIRNRWAFRRGRTSSSAFPRTTLSTCAPQTPVNRWAFRRGGRPRPPSLAPPRHFHATYIRRSIPHWSWDVRAPPSHVHAARHLNFAAVQERDHAHGGGDLRQERSRTTLPQFLKRHSLAKAVRDSDSIGAQGRQGHTRYRRSVLRPFKRAIGRPAVQERVRPVCSRRHSRNTVIQHRV